MKTRSQYFLFCRFVFWCDEMQTMYYCRLLFVVTALVVPLDGCYRLMMDSQGSTNLISRYRRKIYIHKFMRIKVDDNVVVLRDMQKIIRKFVFLGLWKHLHLIYFLLQIMPLKLEKNKKKKLKLLVEKVYID